MRECRLGANASLWRHVFHHVPKCGGNSVMQVLVNWFVLVADYAVKDVDPRLHEAPESFRRRRLSLDEIPWDAPPPRLLCGHFELPGNCLYERYPETAEPPYRRLIFLRDPLERAISHYFYAKRTGRFLVQETTLEAYLERTRNPIASWLAPTPDDALAALEGYWFIGAIERAEPHLARLAEIFSRPVPEVPVANRTPRRAIQLSDGLRRRFRERNRIDYELHARALDRDQ